VRLAGPEARSGLNCVVACLACLCGKVIAYNHRGTIVNSRAGS
jgi:hypothetical protein